MTNQGSHVSSRDDLWVENFLNGMLRVISVIILVCVWWSTSVMMIFLLLQIASALGLVAWGKSQAVLVFPVVIGTIIFIPLIRWIKSSCGFSLAHIVVGIPGAAGFTWFAILMFKIAAVSSGLSGLGPSLTGLASVFVAGFFALIALVGVMGLAVIYPRHKRFFGPALVATSGVSVWAVYAITNWDRPVTDWGDPVVSISVLESRWTEDRTQVLGVYYYAATRSRGLKPISVKWGGRTITENPRTRTEPLESGVSLVISPIDGPVIQLPMRGKPNRIIALPSEPAWLVGYPDEVFLVTSFRVLSLYRAKSGSHLSHLKLCADGSTILFCRTRARTTECIQLDLDEGEYRTLYSFNTEGPHESMLNPKSIVFLDADPRLTIFKVGGSVSRKSGTLAVGFDPATNQMLSVLDPKNLAPNWKRFSWSVSEDGSEFALLTYIKGSANPRFWSVSREKPGTLVYLPTKEWRASSEPASEGPSNDMLQEVSAFFTKRVRGGSDKNNDDVPLRVQ